LGESTLSSTTGVVIATFNLLFPRLAPGGYYVVEDTQTSYWPRDGDTAERNSPRTTIGYGKSLVDGLNWEEFFGDYDPTYLDLSITAIHFYHNLIILRKNPNREGSNNRSWNQNSPEWEDYRVRSSSVGSSSPGTKGPLLR
jgi:hypothetical protein